jgi:hypothetical protein
MKKISRSIVASFLYFVILVAVYYVHVSYFKVNVVFYSAILDGLVATSIVGAGLIGLRYFSVLDSFEKLLLVIIWLLASYALAISVPTVIDRSLSFYILEKLQQRGGGINRDSFELVFVQEYVKEHRLVDVRLTEQLESGTVVMNGDCIKLTEKGNRLAKFSRYFRQNWLPKQRLLMGVYSDDLTDPFKSSSASVDYTCK